MSKSFVLYNIRISYGHLRLIVFIAHLRQIKMKVLVFYFSYNVSMRESVVYKNTLDLLELSIESNMKCIITPMHDIQKIYVFWLACHFSVFSTYFVVPSFSHKVLIFLRLIFLVLPSWWATASFSSYAVLNNENLAISKGYQYRGNVYGLVMKQATE